MEVFKLEVWWGVGGGLTWSAPSAHSVQDWLLGVSLLFAYRIYYLFNLPCNNMMCARLCPEPIHFLNLQFCPMSTWQLQIYFLNFSNYILNALYSIIVKSWSKWQTNNLAFLCMTFLIDWFYFEYIIFCVVTKMSLLRYNKMSRLSIPY